MLRTIRTLVVTAVAAGMTLSLGGCATHEGEGALTGAAVGATAGAIIGNNSHGRTAGGALLGGAIGALIGGSVGREQDIAEGGGRPVYIYDSRPRRYYYYYPRQASTQYGWYDQYGNYHVTREDTTYYAPGPAPVAAPAPAPAPMPAQQAPPPPPPPSGTPYP